MYIYIYIYRPDRQPEAREPQEEAPRGRLCGDQGENHRSNTSWSISMSKANGAVAFSGRSWGLPHPVA